jgi:hypothetical protein
MYLFAFPLLSLFPFFSILALTFSVEIKPKFCVNCRYFIPNTDGLKTEYGKCSIFPYENSKYLVDGIIRDTEYFTCSTARSCEKLCGKNGNRYKKKYVRSTFRNPLLKKVEQKYHF